MRELPIMTRSELHTLPIGELDQLHGIGGIQCEGFLDVGARSRRYALLANREVALGRRCYVDNVRARCRKHLVEICEPGRDLESFCELPSHQWLRVAYCHQSRTRELADLRRMLVGHFSTSNNCRPNHAFTC